MYGIYNQMVLVHALRIVIPRCTLESIYAYNYTLFIISKHCVGIPVKELSLDGTAVVCLVLPPVVLQQIFLPLQIVLVQVIVFTINETMHIQFSSLTPVLKYECSILLMLQLYLGTKGLNNLFYHFIVFIAAYYNLKCA